METKAETLQFILSCAAIIVVLLIFCFFAIKLSAPSPEVMRERAAIEAAQVEAEHRMNMELAELKAKIEAEKPLEVRVQEEKAKETTTGEAITNVAITAGFLYGGLKLLDALSQ